MHRKVRERDKDGARADKGRGLRNLERVQKLCLSEFEIAKCCIYIIL